MENKITKYTGVGRIFYLNIILECAWKHYEDEDFLELGKEYNDYQFIEYTIR